MNYHELSDPASPYFMSFFWICQLRLIRCADTGSRPDRPCSSASAKRGRSPRSRAGTCASHEVRSRRDGQRPRGGGRARGAGGWIHGGKVHGRELREPIRGRCYLRFAGSSNWFEDALEMRRGRLLHEQPRGMRGDGARAALLVLPVAGPLSHRSTAHRSGSIQPL